MFDIRIDAQPFATWFRRAAELLQADARQSLGQAAGLAVRTAKTTTLFKDGPNENRKGPHLRETIGRVPFGPWGWKIQATAKHAKFVEDPTKPHRIEAKKGNVLRFVQAGEVRFRRAVQHPGTKGTHFLQRATEHAGVELASMLERAVQRSFR